MRSAVFNERIAVNGFCGGMTDYPPPHAYLYILSTAVSGHLGTFVRLIYGEIPQQWRFEPGWLAVNTGHSHNGIQSNIRHN